MTKPLDKTSSKSPPQSLSRTRRIRAAAMAALLVAAMVLTAVPADAALSSEVTVEVGSDGTLVIIGDDGDNTVSVHGNGAGYTIWVHRDNGRVDVHNIGSVTNVRVDLGDGRNELFFGHAGPISFPGSVAITGGAGVDHVGIRYATIGSNLIFKPGGSPSGREDGLSVNHSVIAGDLNFTGVSSHAKFTGYYSSVGKRAIVSTVDAETRIAVTLNGFTTARLLVFGSGQDDSIVLQESHLGTAPVINLAGGDNTVRLFRSNEWDAGLIFAAGSGEDRFLAKDVPVGDVLPLPQVDLRMGDGDDLIWLEAGLRDGGPGSHLRGQSGYDRLESNGGFREATVTSIESIS